MHFSDSVILRESASIAFCVSPIRSWPAVKRAPPSAFSAARFFLSCTLCQSILESVSTIGDTPDSRATVSRRRGCEMAQMRRASQLPRIRKRKRTHPPRILIQDQGPRDRRLGALAAILALAEPAIDADRRALGFLEIRAGRIDQF